MGRRSRVYITLCSILDLWIMIIDSFCHCGQSYKDSTRVNFDSRVVYISNLLVKTTLESKFTSIKCLLATALTIFYFCSSWRIHFCRRTLLHNRSMGGSPSTRPGCSSLRTWSPRIGRLKKDNFRGFEPSRLVHTCPFYAVSCYVSEKQKYLKHNETG